MFKSKDAEIPEVRSELSKDAPATNYISTDLYDARDRQFAKAVESVKRHFSDKNRKYGDAIKETGVLGAVVEFVGIAARLKKLVLRSADGGQSSKQDLAEIIKDAAVYAVIAMIMLSEDNWQGQ